MHLKIKYKLFIILLSASILIILSMLLFTRISFERGLNRYVDKVQMRHLENMGRILESQYDREGSWDFLVNDQSIWETIKNYTVRGDSPEWCMPGRNMRLKMKGGVISQDVMPSPHGMEGERRHHRRMFAKQSMDIVLLDVEKKPIMGDVDMSRETRLIPVMHQDKIVGWLGMSRRENPVDDEESLFFQRQSRIFMMIALAMALVSVMVAVWTAYYLERPIRVLTKGTRDLAAGQFKTRIPVSSKDELGQLSRDFNTLAATLEENEKDRKKWVQDIAHELRTPLTLLSGELEAVEDGVRELNEETLLRLKGDIHHLIRLVNDLNELSKTGAGALSYKKTVVDLIPLIRRSSDRFKGAFEEADIVFEDRTDHETPAMILADEERLGQLFGNILQNSLDYTDSGGRIRVRTERLPGRIAVHIEDSAPGVPQDALNRLFDRLYRVESSRNRKTGGSGLGLAICRNIVEAHGGSITASSSDLGGLWMRIELPLNQG